ncbi:hypothetical protein C5167_046291 [Papaver somniferum]|uniref:Uncharacterized protein n=1 Tax=Papaver somniferum TaxID=3469 RepID=A0A4Y7LH71_PAPSO|nr:hypothetical protein C5167_046291 [Papaver somniferum]
MKSPSLTSLMLQLKVKKTSRARLIPGLQFSVARSVTHVHYQRHLGHSLCDEISVVDIIRTKMYLKLEKC